MKDDNGIAFMSNCSNCSLKYGDVGEVQWGRCMANGEKVTMTVDTKIGSVSYKIGEDDFGVAHTN